MTAMDIAGKLRKDMTIVGKLRKGMTRDGVVAVLGEPEDVSVSPRQHRLPAIYRYGEVELHFDNAGRLYMAYTEVELPDGRQGIALLK